MKDKDLHALLTNPRCIPWSFPLTSGDKIDIPHPDYVHFSRKLGQIFHYPEGGGDCSSGSPRAIS